MQHIIEKRQKGKTTKLIKMCAENKGSIIVTPNSNMAHFTFHQAKEMGYDIPYPLTFREFWAERFNRKAYKGFLIDDLDLVLQSTAREIPIIAVTMTERMVVDNEEVQDNS